jgi:hypothetical protein
MVYSVFSAAEQIKIIFMFKIIKDNGYLDDDLCETNHASNVNIYFYTLK